MTEKTERCSICGTSMLTGSEFCKICGLTGKESCAYAIALHTRNPIIKPGNSFEIEVYLTGYGVPKDNKFQVYYTTRGFIDPADPGYIEVSGKSIEESGRKLFKFGDQYKTKYMCGRVGEQIGLVQIYFRTREEYQQGKTTTPASFVPMIIAETMVDSVPPILVHLNVGKKVKPGDYSVQQKPVLSHIFFR